MEMLAFTSQKLNISIVTCLYYTLEFKIQYIMGHKTLGCCNMNFKQYG